MTHREPPGSVRHAAPMPDPHEHDDLHDRGLAFDLATLRARAHAPARFERRGALKLLAGAGAGLVLVACGSDSDDAATTTTSSTTSTTAGGSTTTAGSGTPDRRHPRGDRRPVPRRRIQRTERARRRAASCARTSARASATSPAPPRGSRSPSPSPWSRRAPAPRSPAPPCTCGTAPARAATRCTPTASPTRTSCAASRRPTPTAASASRASTRRLLRTLAPHPLRDLRRPRRRHRRRHARSSPRSWRSPRAPAARCTPPTGYEQSVDNLAQSSLDGDMVFSDGYDTQMATVEGSASTGMTALLTIGV